MKDNKFVLGFIAMICSIGYSENEVLWDFGVEIKPPEIHKVSKDNPHHFRSRKDISQAKINAVITDPFIPPVRNTLSVESSKPLVNEIPEICIHQIKFIAEKSYLRKNYLQVIELLQQRDLSILPEQDRIDLNYLLADAYYHSGNNNLALTQALTMLEQYENDKLYLLLAMIYESLGETKYASKYFQKIIAQYPDSDYFNSAIIKTRILKKH